MLVHEARHLEGPGHVTCTRGERAGKEADFNAALARFERLKQEVARIKGLPEKGFIRGLLGRKR